jgi:predicted nucleic-acid-binding protein
MTLQLISNFSATSNQYNPRREVLEMNTLIQENGRWRNEGIYNGQYVNLKEMQFRVRTEFICL